MRLPMIARRWNTGSGASASATARGTPGPAVTDSQPLTARVHWPHADQHKGVTVGEKELNGDGMADRITFKAKEGATLARGISSPTGGSSDDATSGPDRDGIPGDQPREVSRVQKSLEQSNAGRFARDVEQTPGATGDGDGAAEAIGFGLRISGD